MPVDKGLSVAMNRAMRLYNRGKAEWFNFLADNVVVWSINHSKPYKGRKAYEEHFRPFLVGKKRKARVIHQSIQKLEDSAIVAQTLQIKQDIGIANIRQTVIWGQEAPDGAWRIRHLHSALVGSVIPASPPGNAAAVTVLNEKIASMAAVLGVAQ